MSDAGGDPRSPPSARWEDSLTIDQLSDER